MGLLYFAFLHHPRELCITQGVSVMQVLDDSLDMKKIS
jgi:hypothetical protein|tara:strand:- start:1061 stop:1174 length:114 start_codon:yes stop_codon:yes gene_type:complete